jgi:rhamnosyl/mannosyltransferase
LEEALAWADGCLIGAETLRCHGSTCLIRAPHLLAQRAASGRAEQPVAVVVSRSNDISPILHFWRQPLQRWLLARADAVIVTSPPYLAASSTLTPFRAKAVVVPLGIADPAAAVDAPGVAALRAAHGGRRLVAALGRMAYYKGFDVLLQAATRLAPDVRVLLGGSGPEQAAIERLVRRLGLEERVHLLGDLADAEVATLMAACDVFCLPSTERAEAFGLAMLEAMALGRPVVCSRIEGSGVAWLNQHGLTGLTVPPGDASALAQALQQILDEPGLAGRLGAEARVRYESGFRASQMVDATLALYRRLG